VDAERIATKNLERIGQLLAVAVAESGVLWS
jgi:hypothetical protein